MKHSEPLSAVVEKLGEQVFRTRKESLLMHTLKKVLSADARQDTRKGLKEDDAIVYSDYSKGF